MIYFDEAGYTGSDLTNNEQPNFTLTSIRMNDDEIAQIKKDIDYIKWGKELHFKHMYTNPSGRILLDKIFKHPYIDDNHVLTTYANKRYCIYAYIVDILIETMCYSKGINLYEGAKHLVLANNMYYFAIIHTNKELVSKFEHYFVMMLRKQSLEAIDNFYRTTNMLLYDTGTMKEFSNILSCIPPTIKHITNALPNNKFCLDLTMPLFSHSVQEWYKKTNTKDDILFDSSEPLFANKEFLEQLRDIDAPETLVGYGKNKHIYPLPIGSIGIAMSHEKFGLQLADVFASAYNFVITPRKDKYTKYQDKIKQLHIFQNIKLKIEPSTIDNIKERMKDKAETDPLDFICKHVGNIKL